MCPSKTQSQFPQGPRCRVSYDHRLLCERISLSLHRNPSISLRELSKELGASRRTVQCAVIDIKGKRFRDLREEFLLARVESLLLATPALAIKELSFHAGYTSPRSFARAVRRACGLSPEQLRAHIASDLLTSNI